MRWSYAIGAGVLAAGADVVAHAVLSSHVLATVAGVLLFFAAGYFGRAPARILPAFVGALVHAGLDLVWLVQLLGRERGLPYGAGADLFDVLLDVVAALAGARAGGGRSAH